MRKTLTATAFVLAAALLTGCGGGEEKPADTGKAASSASPQAEKSEESGGSGVSEGPSHEVTIKIEGEGTGIVMYTLDESETPKVTLPWSKTATIAARGAEQEVGRLVIAAPGHMMTADGTYAPRATCSIVFDGKTVVDTKKDPGKPCSYKFK
ncbi:hypothetical protein ACFYQ5_06020 [Streptomyces sp. NPDC005794]|uniref:hypothetical protein n=1 Tax=Streptomyces sp. NPDC005794 TaxID=3364733 RepID=UPI0036C3D32C